MTAAIVFFSLLVMAPLSVAVLKGRWWVAAVVIAAVVSLAVVFAVEPSASFQRSTRFKVVEAGLNIASYGGVATLVYGSAARAKPGSWWDRRGRQSLDAFPPPSLVDERHSDRDGS